MFKPTVYAVNPQMDDRHVGMDTGNLAFHGRKPRLHNIHVAGDLILAGANVPRMARKCSKVTLASSSAVMGGCPANNRR